MSSTVHFKLARPGDQTRKITLEGPSWLTLATKIEALFNIPLESIAVTYRDADGDEVTLSSNEELQEFLAETNDTQTYRLVVKELGKSQAAHSAADNNSSQDEDEPAHGAGGAAFPLFEMIDADEWRVPVPGMPPVIPAGLFNVGGGRRSNGSAYVEEVDDDASSNDEQDEDDLVDNKGKGRGDMPSVVEIDLLNAPFGGTTPKAGPAFAGASPLKPSMHLPESHVGDTATFAPQYHLGVPPRGVSPRPPSRGVSPHPPSRGQSPRPASRAAEETAADPPLPDIPGPQPPPQPHPYHNVLNDVAAVVDGLVGAVSSHPELSEGVRNILRHVGEGSYWQSSADVQADGDSAAAEAGRRIVNSLGEFFRAVTNNADIAVRQSDPGAPQTQSATDAARAAVAAATAEQPPPARGFNAPRGPVDPPRPPMPPLPPQSGWNRAFEAYKRIHGRPMPGLFPPGPPMPPPPPMFGFPPPPHMPFPGAGGPPPPPPPPPPPGAPQAPFPPGAARPFFGPGPNVGPAPPAVPGGRGPRDNWAAARRVMDLQRAQRPGGAAADAGPSTAAASGPPSLPERRAQLEAAKAEYQRQKQAWRREKEEYRREKDRAAQEKERERTAIVRDKERLTRDKERLDQRISRIAGAPTAAQTTTADPAAPRVPSPLPPNITTVPPPPMRPLASQPPEPPVEFSLPGADTTGPDVSFARMAWGGVRPRITPAARIARHLADMGFTETAYPSMPDLIAAQLRAVPEPQGEAEAIMVARLVDELTATRRRTPAPAPGPAAGPDMRGVPGAWRT